MSIEDPMLPTLMTGQPAQGGGFGQAPKPSPKPPQQPGFQNQTSNKQWWGGGGGGAQPQQRQQPPQMATSPYVGMAPAGAPATMGATSGYGTPTPTPPPSTGTPPPTGAPPPTGGGTGGWTGGSPGSGLPPQMSGKSVWLNANKYQGLMDKIARMDARRGPTGRFSGSPQDISRMNQDYQRAQESAKVWRAQLEKSMAGYKGHDGWSGGADPRAILMDYSSKMGDQDITSLIESMYGPSAPRMTPPGYVEPPGFSSGLGGPAPPRSGGGWK